MLAHALVHKFGFAQGLITIDGKIAQYPTEWGEIPTKKEQVTIVREYTDYLKSIKYKEDRKPDYPDMGDQLDEIMKWLSTEKEIGIPSKLKSMAMKCMAVKSKYPKPKGDK